jgi:AcrR family transcriptional regulator
VAERAQRRAGRIPRVTREQVIDEAVALADAGGLDTLTMRSLGERLGVEAMSLYRHVRNKEDVLDGMVDLVFRDIDLGPDGADWRTAMRLRAMSAREALTRHPWAIGLLESRTRPGPENLRHHDAVLGILKRAGFTPPLATRAYNVLDSYIFGFALQERTLPVATPEALAEVGDSIIAQMPAEAYPHLREVGLQLMAAGFNYADEFEFGLDVILDGLADLVRRRPGRGGPRKRMT